MGYWTKSHLIFNSFCEYAKASIRQVARQTGLSKSSVHRLGRAMDRRNGHPESWFWETEEGHRWLIRLVVAVLYHFGLKRGVGAETMVLWDFPECKIALISMSYVHMYLSENVEKSVKQCVRPLRFPSTSLR